jgi:hypothetical protein
MPPTSSPSAAVPRYESHREPEAAERGRSGLAAGSPRDGSAPFIIFQLRKVLQYPVRTRQKGAWACRRRPTRSRDCGVSVYCDC